MPCADTEILSIARADVEKLIERHGDFAAALARLVLARTRKPEASFQRGAPRIFALISTSPSIDVDARTKDLAKRISAHKVNVTWFPVGDAAPNSREFDLLENAHEVVLLAARVDDSPWYRFVQRHADRFLVLARRDARPSKPFPLTLEAGERARKFRLVDLIVLHEGAHSGATAEWMDVIGRFARHKLPWRQMFRPAGAYCFR